MYRVLELGLRQERSTFIDYAGNMLKDFLSFNQLGYLQSVHFDNSMLKHKFWQHIYDMPTRDEQDHKIK